MMDKWEPPAGHPIDEKRAKELISGDLGVVYRQILQDCCAPIFWYENRANSKILNNGTVTIVRTPDRLLGVTAAHVVNSYFKQSEDLNLILQIGEEVVSKLRGRIISISDQLDLATIDLERLVLNKKIIPLSWPPKIPHEGRGIMLAGYPGNERLEQQRRHCNFGTFTAIGIARMVKDEEITFLIDRENGIPNKGIKELPQNHDLGGISGGPIISWFETKNFITSYHFAGIVSEASSEFEYIVGKRADFINQDGSIKS